MLTIETITEAVVPIAKTFDVLKVGLFGSFARGEATENSDIDLIISYDKDNLKMRGWYFFGFGLAVEEALERKVDVLTYKGIEASILKQYIMPDEVTIYER